MYPRRQQTFITRMSALARVPRRKFLHGAAVLSSAAILRPTAILADSTMTLNGSARLGRGQRQSTWAQWLIHGSMIVSRRSRRTV